MSVSETIANRIRQLRADCGWSLDVLAERSGVSRANISLIERGKSSPTAIVLDKLATALHVPLASLFEAPAHESADEPLPVSRSEEQSVWKDPASGYVRRHLSPRVRTPVQLVEVKFPAGKQVSYDTALQGAEVHQQVWIIRGVMEMTIGDTKWRLEEGDCLAMRLDRPVTFHNPTRSTAHYIVAVTTFSSSNPGSNQWAVK